MFFGFATTRRIVRRHSVIDAIYGPLDSEQGGPEDCVTGLPQLCAADSGRISVSGTIRARRASDGVAGRSRSSQARQARLLHRPQTTSPLSRSSSADNTAADAWMSVRSAREGPWTVRGRRHDLRKLARLMRPIVCGERPGRRVAGSGTEARSRHGELHFEADREGPRTRSRP